MSQPSKSPLPQVAYSDAPEAMTPPAQQAQAYPHYDSALAASEHPKGRTILGLRQSTFWLRSVLIAVVIIAAVGGGVGGSIAVKNAKSGAKSEGLATTVSSPDNRTSASSSSASLIPSSTSLSPGSTYTPIPPSEVNLVSVSCPSEPYNMVYMQYNKTFTCKSGTDYSGSDITGVVAYTWQQCLQACVLAHDTCVAVTYSGNLKESVKVYGANCWLKTDTKGERDVVGWVSWRVVG